MQYCREARRDTPTNIGKLAISLERLTPDLEDMSSNFLCGKNSVHWLKAERPLGSGLSSMVTQM